MRAELSYRPATGGDLDRPLQRAGALPALAYLGALVLVAFVYSSPLVLLACGAAIVLAGLASGAGAALRFAARYGAALGVVIVAVNALVNDRGDTVLIRGYEVPVLGSLDVTLESLAAGGVLALRIVVVIAAFAVYSACVDPDAVLRLIRPIARRSALTASLIARLVPLAAADHIRLREAAALRGPVAAPVGRATLARRLVAGALDRSLDVAATLELRGYALPAGRVRAPTPRSHPLAGAFLATGATIAAAGIASRAPGIGAFDDFPTLTMELGTPELALALALPVAATIPLALDRLFRRRRAHASPRMGRIARA
jgi:energy-coupling factor transporter transmembrane protein EcfT